MNFPSIKTLAQVFGDNAKKAREIIEMQCTGLQLTEFNSVVEMRRTCYHSPTKLMVKMAALNELSGSHGVEACETEEGEEYLEYLNSGDVYNVTLMHWRGRWIVGTVGGFIERSRVKFR